MSLIESLVLGLKSLSYSAKMAGEEDEQLSDKEMAGTIILAIVLASILFIAIPTGSAKFFHEITDDPVFLNLMEGVLRLVIFIAYIFAISQMKDIQRVFQYHGAEHKLSDLCGLEIRDSDDRAICRHLSSTPHKQPSPN